MAIPIGRFIWNLSGNVTDNVLKSDQFNRAKNYVKAWGGYVDANVDGYRVPGDSGAYWYDSNGVIRITLPPVVSSSGLIWYATSNTGCIQVTLGPKDLYRRFKSDGQEYSIDPYAQNQPVYCVYNNFYMEAPSFCNKSYWIYQSFGSNTYTVSRCPYADSRRFSTMGVLVTKGTHLSSGKPSTLILLPSSSTGRDWDSFSFWIWNPIINNWITGSLKGIKQSMTDSSHILITPIELNGYSFPNVYFADATSNPAFGAYCAAEQLREYEYSIKFVNLNNQDYYIPITHSNKTVILINHVPNGITVAH